MNAGYLEDVLTALDDTSAAEFLQSDEARKDGSRIRSIIESGALHFNNFPTDKAAWVLFGAILLGG